MVNSRNPIVNRLSTISLEPMEVFLRLPQEAKSVAFLASNGSADSRWSILAWDPVESVRGLWSEVDRLSDAFEKRRMNYRGHLPFVSGGIGTIDYEGAVEFSFYDSALMYDHHEKQWWGISADVVKPGGTIHELSLPIHLHLEPVWNFEQYQQAFNIVHENIRKGEIYQACLTFPFTGPAAANTRELFVSLLRKNPAPMAAYLEQTDRTVMSLSPERFIQWDGTTLETKPIKGTRPRGETPEEDNRLRDELLANEKEQAELTMITDLLRNDLARVSKPGTVKVLHDHELQATPNVWHTYSHIQSETKEGIGAWNIVQSMFPGGSISGCPKQRAIEILKEVEDQPRGIYTGCIAYISDHGTMDMNIAIRTLEQTKDGLKAGFGSGIVYDSLAATEYQECFDKAKNFL